MKTITNIQEENMDEPSVVVTVEEYPNASPVFKLADVSPDGTFENLDMAAVQTKVDEWSITQDEVDSINNGTASQEVLDKEEKRRVIAKFDGALMKSRMSESFAPGRMKALSQFLYTIDSFIAANNFAQLKGFLDYLVFEGDATVEDYNQFNSIMKEQGIDLNDPSTYTM